MEVLDHIDDMEYIKYLVYSINGDPPLTPSRHGKKCLGNGEHPDYECCCDECDYFLRCYPEYGLRVYRERSKKLSGKTFKSVIIKK